MTRPTAPQPSDSGADPLVALLESTQRVARKLESRPLMDPRIHPLTPVERLVIQTIERHPGTSLHDLAARVKMQTSNASAAVKRLVELNMVARSRDAEDGRRMLLFLTDEARDTVDRVHAEWLDAISGAALVADDLDAAVRAMGTLDAWLTED
jgi:DNA-binding MarR family transcriptional regulator